MVHLRYQQYIPLLLFGVLAVLSFMILKPLFTALFLGALLAYILHPVHLFFMRWMKMNATLSAVLLCALVLIMVLVPGSFFIKTMVTESYSLFILVKQRLGQGLFEQCSNSFCTMIKHIGQNPVFNTQFQDLVKTITSWIIHQGSGFVFLVPMLLVSLLVFLFALFYFLKEGESMMEKMGEYLTGHEGTYFLVQSRLKDMIHGLIFGNVLVALLQGMVGALGFFLFGVSSALFWGMAMAFLALIPYLGTWIIWVPASLILFLDGIFQNSTGLVLKGVGLFVYSFFLVNMLDHFLKPKLAGQRARVHPLVIFLGTIGGLMVFGPLGVLLGPIILSLTLLLSIIYLK